MAVLFGMGQSSESPINRSWVRLAKGVMSFFRGMIYVSILFGLTTIALICVVTIHDIGLRTYGTKRTKYSATAVPLVLFVP